MTGIDEGNEINRKIGRIRDRRGENMLDKKVSLSLKTLISFLIITVFITSSFLVGRYIFPSGSSVIDGVSAAATSDLSADTEILPEPENSVELINESESLDDTGMFSNADDSSSDEEAEDVAADTAEDIVETIISGTYDNVALEFTKTPTYDWKGTWGKVTTIYYTIKNGEAGTIKPSKFRIIVEGYESADFIKTYDVPAIDTTIKSGEEAKHGVDVKLQYSESVTDPTNLQITMQLLDDEGLIMDAHNQEFNLKS